MHALKPDPGLEVGAQQPLDSNISENRPTAAHIPMSFLLQEIPMNFVDPKEYDIPGLVRKNRYKTILPSEYSVPWG